MSCLGSLGLWDYNLSLKKQLAKDLAFTGIEKSCVINEY